MIAEPFPYFLNDVFFVFVQQLLFAELADCLK